MSMHAGWRSVALIAIAAGFLGVAASAQPPPAAESDPLTDARFFTGPMGTQGTFPGKLVCLCCDFQAGAATKEPCKEQHHKLGLKIEGDPTVHPLVPGDKVAMKQLESADMHGKQVSVTGKLYPSVGIIVVASITPQK